MNVLFVCSLNKIRSLTAEHIFQNIPDLSVRSAGTQSNARVVVNDSLLRWADSVFVMEEEHKKHIERKFPLLPLKNKIIILGIEGDYEYMDPMLVEILMREVLPRLGILHV